MNSAQEETEYQEKEVQERYEASIPTNEEIMTRNANTVFKSSLQPLMFRNQKYWLKNQKTISLMITWRMFLPIPIIQVLLSWVNSNLFQWLPEWVQVVLFLRCREQIKQEFMKLDSR